PSATTGVPVTPTSRCRDQRFVKRPAVVAATVRSVAFKREFARSCPYSVQSRPLPESATEPRAVVVDDVGPERAECDAELELHALASATHAMSSVVCNRREARVHVPIWSNHDTATTRSAPGTDDGCRYRCFTGAMTRGGGESRGQLVALQAHLLDRVQA